MSATPEQVAEWFYGRGGGMHTVAANIVVAYLRRLLGDSVSMTLSADDVKGLRTLCDAYDACFKADGARAK